MPSFTYLLKCFVKSLYSPLLYQLHGTTSVKKRFPLSRDKATMYQEGSAVCFNRQSRSSYGFKRSLGEIFMLVFRVSTGLLFTSSPKFHRGPFSYREPLFCTIGNPMKILNYRVQKREEKYINKIKIKL